MSKAASRKLWSLPLALLVGVGLGMLVWQSGGSKQTAPAPSPAMPAPPSPAASHVPAEAGTDASVPAESSTVPVTPQASLLNGEAAQEAISELSSTYDAASVPALALYLKHSDAEIRAAARDGLINLGERAAIPFLEEAAKAAPADEAIQLREAAEFLALPTWTEQREARKKAKAAGGSAQ